MNGSTHPNDRPEAVLCPACGLCCNGVIFANVGLRPGDDAERLGSLGLPLRTPPSGLRPPKLAQPCAAFDGCRCRVYADRPQYCRQFECLLLKSVKAGHMDAGAALAIIGTARKRVHKVRRLLAALGDTDEHLPLSARFRHMGKRLHERALDGKTAGLYGELTLAFHRLNLLLSDAFYPGGTGRPAKSSRASTAAALLCAALILLISPGQLRADQVEMQNGDRYAGQVVSVNTNTVVLQSDVLGTVRLPRAKVATIALGAKPATNSPALLSPADGQSPPPAATPTNAAVVVSPALRQLGAHTNLIRQVQKQFLGDAGPEANSKFNDLLGGLMSGSISVDDIRAQAKSAADQLRAMKRDTGEDAGFATDAYLTILDHFLKDTAPSAAATNTAPASPKSAPAPKAPEE